MLCFLAYCIGIDPPLFLNNKMEILMLTQLPDNAARMKELLHFFGFIYSQTIKTPDCLWLTGFDWQK